jgi:hypothetical protein
VNWCEVRLVERPRNLGLGTSILSGVSQALREHDAVIAFEDDLVCVPGAYVFLSAALRHYRFMPQVMSVTGWTHPRVTPAALAGPVYFDGRAECLVWGTWARAWEGMVDAAARLVQRCREAGIDPARYGHDLPEMAEAERRRNIWAVRWLLWHVLNGGLCMRPAHSLVEHIGFDSQATNARDGTEWSNPPLRACPPLPAAWPDPVEHPDCARLWRAAAGRPPSPAWQALRKVKRAARAFLR